MATALLFGVFGVLLIIGVPVAFALSAASLATVLYLGLPSLVAFDLGVLPLLPLLTCAGAARTSTRRILLALPVACALVALSVTRTMWSGQILTLRGLALVALATTATLLLLRWRLRQHYRGCDLTSEIGIGALTGLPATSPR